MENILYSMATNHIHGDLRVTIERSFRKAILWLCIRGSMHQGCFQYFDNNMEFFKFVILLKSPPSFTSESTFVPEHAFLAALKKILKSHSPDDIQSLIVLRGHHYYLWNIHVQHFQKRLYCFYIVQYWISSGLQIAHNGCQDDLSNPLVYKCVLRG